MTPRAVCLDLLTSTERGQEYSNIALDKALKKYPDLKPVDRRFISALYYGVLERKLTLDAVIEKYSNRPSDKQSIELRQILRMGIYQILFMDTVPESAAVNESVKLERGLKNPSAEGFVNALLRNFLRDGSKLPKTGVKLKDLSIEYSIPEWIIKLWTKDYGEQAALSILAKTLGAAPITVKFNTFTHSLDAILNELSSQGVTAQKVTPASDCYNLTNCGSVESLSAYQKGMFHVQDLSCQLCCLELGAKPGETVLDLCSAPGGKAFTVAEMMEDRGRLLAYDLHKNRVRLITSGAARLGLKSITAAENDAKIFNNSIPSADRILCDVPCSGLGVIRRKPDIKYRADEDASALTATQYAILTTSAKYLKPGGTLIYSTCTLRRAENDDIVERFLNENPDFEPVKLDNFTDCKVTIFPDDYESDGFFIAKMTRKR